jgi:hypothetical protein
LNATVQVDHEDYYVFVWRLVSFVRECDRIVDLFNATGHKLLMIWSGPDEDLLKARAKSNIQFLWHIRDVDKKLAIIKKSRWLINIAKESFGLNTLESLLCWVPVLWFAQWATPELFGTINDISQDVYVSPFWLLVHTKSHQNLVSALELFHTTRYDRHVIREKILTHVWRNYQYSFDMLHI